MFDVDKLLRVVSDTKTILVFITLITFYNPATYDLTSNLFKTVFKALPKKINPKLSGDGMELMLFIIHTLIVSILLMSLFYSFDESISLVEQEMIQKEDEELKKLNELEKATADFEAGYDDIDVESEEAQQVGQVGQAPVGMEAGYDSDIDVESEDEYFKVGQG